MARRPILAANWKMHMTAAEAVAYAEAFVPRVGAAKDVEIAIAPPFTALDRLARALAGSNVMLAAQNVHPEAKGAFTGEISADMLVEVGCRYVIVGHSERRTLFGESDELVARKAAALFAAGLTPIVCVGESLAEREAGRTFDVVGSQLAGSLAAIPADRAAAVVVAYEPIWAIGTGRTATPEIAQEVHAFARAQLRTIFGAAGDAIRIQYGGSVKPDNIDELMAQPDIDGALVGGASLDPASFSRIVCFEKR
jgi:triosephosphate isomerase